MAPELYMLRLELVESMLLSRASVAKLQRPRRGYLKLIRETIGRTQRQQARRLGVTGSSLHKLEQLEVDERISLRKLRELADALDCELVYTLVPRRPLEDVVREQAREVALREVSKVAHSMDLEGQRPAQSRLEKQVEWRTDELIRGRWSALWRKDSDDER